MTTTQLELSFPRPDPEPFILTVEQLPQPSFDPDQAEHMAAVCQHCLVAWNFALKRPTKPILCGEA
jgi:hypothetical protein